MNAISPGTVVQHPFLTGLPPEFAERIADFASVRSVPARYRFFEEGGRADRFWLIETGQVALDVHVPGRPPLIIETLGAGDLMGLSWLGAPPRTWEFGAEAVQPCVVFELDARAIAELCDHRPDIGYQVYQRLIRVLTDRLHATRFRLLDLYSPPGQRHHEPAGQRRPGSGGSGRPA